MVRSPPLKQRDALQLFARRLGDDLDSAVERIVFIHQRQVGASAAEEFGKHFRKVDPHLGKGFGKQFLGRRIDLRDHVEQFAARIGEIVVLGFEEFVSLFQLVVFLYGFEIDRTHVVELAGEIGDQVLQVFFGKITSGAGRHLFAFELNAQSVVEFSLVGSKGTQINLVTARNALSQILDLHLQLRLPDLLMAAIFLKRAQGVAQFAKLCFTFLHGAHFVPRAVRKSRLPLPLLRLLARSVP